MWLASCLMIVGLWCVWGVNSDGINSLQYFENLHFIIDFIYEAKWQNLYQNRHQIRKGKRSLSQKIGTIHRRHSQNHTRKSITQHPRNLGRRPQKRTHSQTQRVQQYLKGQLPRKNHRQRLLRNGQPLRILYHQRKYGIF